MRGGFTNRGFETLCSGFADVDRFSFAVHGFHLNGQMINAKARVQTVAYPGEEVGVGDGFVMAEGAGALVIESYDAAKARANAPGPRGSPHAPHAPGPLVISRIEPPPPPFVSPTRWSPKG